LRDAEKNIPEEHRAAYEDMKRLEALKRENPEAFEAEMKKRAEAGLIA